MGTLKGSWFDWNDQAIADLRALFADGLSASQIADELGPGLTRNSIIGKVNRLGLTRAGHPSSANTGAHPKHRPAPRRHAPFRARPAPVPPPPPPPPPEPVTEVDDNAIPIAQRRTLLQLTNSTCRWPLPGDTVEFFCGHPSADLNIGIPYCRIHGARAYQPSARRLDNIVTWGVRQQRSAGRARA